VRVWSSCLVGEHDWQVEREAGRFDLATELVEHAIETGRLRCAFVVRSEHQPTWGGTVLPRLEVIPAEEFIGKEVSHSWDDGFSLDVYRAGADDDDESAIVEGFYLFWDEVALLRPSRNADDRDEAEPDPPVSYIGRLRPEPIVQQANRRGRRPRRYGAPIAAFLARAASHGLHEAAAEKDEELGRWLLEEFERQGDGSPPDLRNASADARGALTVWIKAVAQTV